MRRLLFLAVCVVACARASSKGSLADERPTTTTSLIVVGTTDVHGWLRGWDYFANAPDTTRGLTRVASIVDSIRAANPDRVVVVDAGDDLQGTAITSIALRDSVAPNPIVAAMNAVGYDAGVIGNHEFNYGLPFLTRSIAQARFPMLAANAYLPNGQHAYTPWVMIMRSGLRVAIVGGTTPGSMLWDRDKLRGRVEVRDIVPSVREAVAQARARSADVVVVVLHSGLNEPSSYDTAATGLPSENVVARVAREVPGIDLIVFGHSHKELPDTTIAGTLVTQPRNWAGSVSVARLDVTRGSGRSSVGLKSARVIRTRGWPEHASVLAATQDAHTRAMQYAASPVGSTPAAWRADSARVKDTPIIDLVLEVMRRTAGTDLASTAAFSLNADFGPGPITMADMAELYPYENNVLRAVRISGRQLREYLEFSARYFRENARTDSLINPSVPGFNFDIIAGVDYAIDITKPIGSRITTLSRNGRPVAETDTFTMALNDYRQVGGGGYAMLQGAPLVYDQQQVIRQLLIEEVQRKGVIRPEEYFTPNWRLVPDTMVGAAYRAMRRLPFDRPRVVVPAPGAPLGGPRVRIISTNDMHGYLEPWTDRDGVLRGGAAALATAIARARAECVAPDCASLVVDAGDMMQGPALSSVVYGKPVIEAMNAIGYDAAAVGNHEFDWGPDTLRARMREARFPVLSANTRFKGGGDVPWLRSDTILTRGRFRIGVIGLTTTGAATSSRAGADGFEFPNPARMTDSIARSLRSRGVDAVIVVAHTGARCAADGRTDCKGEIVDLANAVGRNVDAIISGHSHTFIDTDVDGVPLVQARSWAQAIAVTDIPVTRGPTGPGARHEVRGVYPDSLRPDSAVAAIVKRAADAVSHLTSVRVAVLRDSLLRRGDEHALGRVIADAHRAAGRGDVAAMNNGGIRADLYPGPITYGMVFEVQPFRNRLHRITLTGAALRQYFESLAARQRPGVHISGAAVRYDTTRARGSRVIDVRLADGRAFSDAATYVLVVNEFMSEGGDNFETVKLLTDEALPITDVDALVEYLRRQPSPVAAPATPRFVNVGRP